MGDLEILTAAEKTANKNKGTFVYEYKKTFCCMERQIHKDSLSDHGQTGRDTGRKNSAVHLSA